MLQRIKLCLIKGLYFLIMGFTAAILPVVLTYLCILAGPTFLWLARIFVLGLPGALGISIFSCFLFFQILQFKAECSKFASFVKGTACLVFLCVAAMVIMFFQNSAWLRFHDAIGYTFAGLAEALVPTMVGGTVGIFFYMQRPKIFLKNSDDSTEKSKLSLD